MENKLKHLEFIQDAINRMAGHSFVLKGWSVTLVAALFALATKDTNPKYILVAYFPVLIFWLLDAYFLWQERLFRALYDEVRQRDDKQIDFSMDIKRFCGGNATWMRAIFSNTLVVFYPALLILMIFIMMYLK